MSEKAYLSNSDPFSGRVADAQETWVKMLSKYTRLGISEKLKNFSITCNKKRVCVEFHKTIHAKFSELILGNESIKKSIAYLKPYRFSLEEERLFAQDESGLSVVSLLLKKACEKIIYDSGESEALERCKLKKKLCRILQSISSAKCKSKVKVRGKKEGGIFNVELFVSCKNKKGEKIFETTVVINKTRAGVIEELNSYAGFIKRYYLSQ